MRTKTEPLRIYRGVLIERAPLNSSGVRWVAFAGLGVALRADTLAGTRELIRDAFSARM